MPIKEIGKPTALVETPLQKSLDILKGKYADIPTPEEWQKALKGASPPPAASQASALIAKYHDTKRALHRCEKAFIVKDLYKDADDYLKANRIAPAQEAAKIRYLAMQDLFKASVLKLCDAFECHVNVLPLILEQVYFDVRHRQANEQTNYLQEAAREIARLVIKDGKFYGWGTQFGLVDTNDPEMAAQNHGFVDGEVACEAGFVLSPWRQLYMRKHGINLNLFHSQYMAGHQVACAGEMTIRNGVLEKVSNASGHYQPTSEQLLPLLWMLSRKGVPLGNVRVIALEPSGLPDRMYAVECSAAEYLAKAGKLIAGATQWLETYNNVYKKLRRVTGRISFENGAPITGGYEVAFDPRRDGDLWCRGAVNADGTFTMGITLGVGPNTTIRKTRWVPGILPYNDYDITLIPPGYPPPTQPPRAWAPQQVVGGIKQPRADVSVGDHDNNFFELVTPP